MSDVNASLEVRRLIAKFGPTESSPLVAASKGGLHLLPAEPAEPEVEPEKPARRDTVASDQVFDRVGRAEARRRWEWV